MTAGPFTAEAALESLVARVVDEFLERQRRGEQPDPAEYAARYPQATAVLREVLAALRLIGLSSAPGPGGASGPPLAEGAGADTLGDFRLIREIGRGGMGIVYEAEQLSLERRVALKVLPFAAALDTKQLQRFQNEARAAAHLHHSNIVPVHAVGCARGMHFYAMQFIDGQTLATLIRELRQRAGLEGPAPTSGAGSAGAWASNLVSAPRPPSLPDAAPEPRTGPSPAETPAPGTSTSPVAVLPTEGATRHPIFFPTVARLGLQAAEALEYAHVEGIIHRDIKPANLLLEWRAGGVSPLSLWITDFGLARFRSEAGLTLTGDLLGTLRYMSPEQALGPRQRVDHRTDIYSLGATLYELLTLEPVHAASDRQELLHQISAVPPRPPRRLNPAVPADLETIVVKALDKEPEGRYATAQELADDLRRFLEDKPIRARRPTLCRRVRKWARRHQPVVIAGLAALFLGMVAWAVSTVLILRQRDDARAQRALAQEQRELARQAVDDMYTEVAEQWLAQQPHMEEVQRRFLLKALRYYEAFAAEPGTDPALRLQAGVASQRVGDIDFKLGRYAEAEAACEKAIALEAELAAQFPDVPAYRRELARSQDHLALLLLEVGRPQPAEQAHRRALPLWERLVADFPMEPDYRWGLATSYLNFGRLLARTGRPQEAEPAYRQADALLEKLTAERPTPEIDRDHATVQNNLASLLWFQSRLAAAEQALRRALAMQEKLAAASPTAPQPRRDLALTRSNLALLLGNSGQSQEAEQVLRQAVAAREQLVAEFPGVPAYRSDLANSYNTLGGLLRNLGRHTEEEQAYCQALALQDRLATEFPNVTEYGLYQAVIHLNLANVLEDSGREPKAEQAYRQAVLLYEKVVAGLPGMPEGTEGLAHSYRRLGYLLWRTDQADEAAPALRQARAAYEKWAADNPNAIAPAWHLALFLADCPDPHYRDVPRAVGLAQEAVDRAPKDVSCWKTLGIAQFRAGEWQAALKTLHQALDLGAGGDSWDWFYLAMAYGQVGEKDRARQWFDRACAATDKTTVAKPWLLRLRAEAADRLGLPRPAEP
jgi:serine/threonine protein kinase/tetratricopeptide (TPR) repeat protein